MGTLHSKCQSSTSTVRNKADENNADGQHLMTAGTMNSSSHRACTLHPSAAAVRNGTQGGQECCRAPLINPTELICWCRGTN